MNRSSFVLVSLLVGLGIITYFLLPSKNEHETSYEPQDLSLRLDSASVVKIAVQQKGKSVTIENIGGKWLITWPIRYAADATAIKQLLSGLSKFKVGSLISSNPEKQNIFQVDSTGTKLTVTDRSGKTVGLIIGKMGPSYSEVYFRLPDSKDVYLGEGIDTWAINKDVKEWRDKTIVSTPSEGMKGLVYKVSNKQYQFERDSSGWQSKEKPVDASSMTPALNQLANLHADDFIDSLMQIETQPIVLEVHGADDLTLNLFPSKPDSSKYYVQLSSSPQLFVISKWTAQQLFKPVESSVSAPRTVRKQPAASPPEEVAEQKVPPETKVTQQPPVVQQKPPVVQQHETPVVRNVPPAVKEQAPVVRKEPPVAKKEPPAETPTRDTTGYVRQTPTRTRPSNPPPQRTEQAPASPPKTQPAGKSSTEDEGELTVYTVKRGETMTMIAKQFNVSVEQILKWNLLKSIGVKPGQELYIYLKK